MSKNDRAIQHNRQAWNRLTEQNNRFTKPAKDEEFVQPLNVLDANGWLGNVRGKQLLCLAAGGGRQGPLYAAAGADVTVVDISSAQLEIDRRVAAQRNLQLTTIEASMDDLSMFPETHFDIVIQPVSTCYVAELRPVFKEVARITKPNGLYVSQHKQPASLQATVRPGSSQHYELLEPYYRRGPLPPADVSLHREKGTLEFLHRWEELIGFLCRAGFFIEDLVEPRHGDPTAAPGTFAHRSLFVPPYVRLKARRRPFSKSSPRQRASIWTPNDD